MTKKQGLTKNEEKMLNIMETAIVHCDWQIKAIDDPDTKREWLVRKLTCEKLLKAFKETLKVVD